MKPRFFKKENVNKSLNQDNIFYLPIVELLKDEKWHLAETKNIYKHFYNSPEDLMAGEKSYIDKLPHLSCYKVNLTPEQVAQVKNGTKIQHGYRAAVCVASWQVECRIEFNQFGHNINQNAGYFKKLIKEEGSSQHCVTV